MLARNSGVSMRALRSFWSILGWPLGWGRHASADPVVAAAQGLRPTSRWRQIRRAVVMLMLAYAALLYWRFGFVRGFEIDYPQAVLRADYPTTTTADGKSCTKSRLVAMAGAITSGLTVDDIWAPASMQYKIGLFGLVPFADTPWFDNKASFQLGALRALRRTAVELVDTLGRVRGTSEADKDLEAARGRLQYDEATAIFNPGDARRPFGPVQASGSVYRQAIRLFGGYNQRLANCNALFDVRADNLADFLDRVAKDIGSTIDQLATRSQGRRYDPKLDQFVAESGTDSGWFDMRADNLFWAAKGEMMAWHGLLQATRDDFAPVIAQRNAADLWDRMEQHIAEAAALDPLIVSNGREDGFAMPDHLSVMAQKMLRAQANMSELREVLSR